MCGNWTLSAIQRVRLLTFVVNISVTLHPPPPLSTPSHCPPPLPSLVGPAGRSTGSLHSWYLTIYGSSVTADDIIDRQRYALLSAGVT